MTRERGAALLSKKRDLTIISAFMVLMLLFAVAAEDPEQEPPEWYVERFDDGGGGQDDPKDDVTETRTDPIFSKGGFTSEGGVTEEVFQVDEDGSLEIEVLLTWTDDIGNNDNFRMSLSNSSGEIGYIEGTAGSLAIDVVAEQAGDLIGEYTVTVEALDCPGLMGPIPIDRDSGNDWTIDVILTYEV